ncbi:MAG: spore coat protein U domain-containing protein [Alkalispirochaeta sp.]
MLTVILMVWGSFAAYGFGTIEMTAPDPVTESYSTSAGVEVNRSVELSVGGSFDRSYDVGFSAGSSGDVQRRRLVGAEETIRYDLLDNITDQNLLTDIEDGGTVLSGTIPAGTRVEESFVVRIAPDRLPAAGTYTDTVTISAYDVFGDVRSQATLSIVLEVATALQLTVSTNDLDLGELVEGTTGAVRLIVEANASYGIELTSPSNEWRMAHQDETVASFVPYLLRLDNRNLDMGDSAIVIPGFQRTPLPGREHQLEVVVGNTDNAISGPHADVIDITVTANQ